MADQEFDDLEGGYYAPYEDVPVGPTRASRAVTVVGALMSAAMIAGLGVWGYKVAVRNVMGIPVVQAQAGSMRVAPSDPGGDTAAHQGLSVNSVAAEGIAAPTTDRMVLAPRWVEISEDDAPGLTAEAPKEAPEPKLVQHLMPLNRGFAKREAVAALAGAPEAVEAASLVVDVLQEPASLDLDALADEAGTSDPAVIAALAAALSAGAEPPADLAADVSPAITGRGIPKSLRPLARPQDVVARASLSADVGVPASDVKEVDLASLAKGTRLVQLGVFKDEVAARLAWDKMDLQFGELLAGKGRVVEVAQNGGGTFYRLRAEGFDGEDDARRFCSALTAENATCIPVAIR